MKKDKGLLSVENMIECRSEQNAGSKNCRVFCSNDLFGDEREIYIRHSDRHYRLQITKAGKLILNK